MVRFAVGIILFAAPFLAVNLFKDKKRGFLYVLFFLFAFHIILAFFTQLFGIFHYWAIIAVSFLTDLMVIFFYFKKEKNGFLFKVSRSVWLPLAVALIAFLSLYQVHYNYTGDINSLTVDGNLYGKAENMKYIYPYFSDEWYSVFFIKSSIASHSLPLKNILDNNGFFPNLEMFTHSFLAEIMLVFGLDPLSQYVLLSIFVNSLIIILTYIFLRSNNVSKLASAVSSLSVLYIVSADSLPGIWHLIPITLGIVFSLMGFSFIALNDIKMALLAFLATSLFYPLLFPFYGLAVLVFLFFKFKKKIFGWLNGFFGSIFNFTETKHLIRNKEKNFRKISYFVVGLILTFLIIAILPPVRNFIKYAFSKLFYVSLLGDFVPQINIFYVIPLPIIFLAFWGLFSVFKNKKWIFSQFLVGTAYWILYFFTTYRIIIDFERIVYFTSIIIAVISGFGLDNLVKYINLKFKNIVGKFAGYAEVFAVFLFLLFIPFYTDYDGWKKFVAINYVDGAVTFPAAPANRYLTEDDIRLFANIKGKRFLSVPWKGAVVGIATDNYPVAAKAGTISIGSAKDANLFSMSNCETKKNIAEEKKIDYVYLGEFYCEGFEKISRSAEGFTLYKTSYFND